MNRWRLRADNGARCLTQPHSNHESPRLSPRHAGFGALQHRCGLEGSPELQFINLGGTLAELNDYILSRGGQVVDVVALVNAGRNPDLLPVRKDVRLIKERFKDEFTEIFGIRPEALTANEARYLVGFRSLDEIRDCLSKARQEIDRRLRSKGISRSGSTAPGPQGGIQLNSQAE